MPWEKSFCEEEALQKAARVFWSKGFEAASIADLIEATGVNRGSLYNAFGGKRALFVRSLLAYDRDTRQSRLARLEAQDAPKAAIASFFDDNARQFASDAERKGCLLINTALELQAHDADAQGVVTRGMTELEAFFRRNVEAGLARGEIHTDLDAAQTAKALLALHVGMVVLSRGVFTEPDLQTVADQAKRLIA